MKTDFHLHNKTILVTGATGGIGSAIALGIAKMGATVIVTGRNIEKLTSLVTSLEGEHHKMIVSDLVDETSRKLLVSELTQLDGIVHASGMVFPYPIKYLNQKKIDETLTINYEAPVLLMSEITSQRKLNNNASIVFLSSISGQHPHKGGAIYAGSKAALEAFSKVLSLELQHKKIRSNCISPAMVKTAMYEIAEQNMSKEEMDNHIKQYPLGVGYPEDVSNAVVFLLSKASRWITGQNIILDGGFLLG
ncbi:MAG: SDR family oxidoreductase [Flavobacteriaceae bacterium]|nr:SDR family oxidoreductase [Flavobacteriaceae bacterium]